MKHVQLDKFENSWYKPGKGKVILLLWYFTNIFFFKNSLNPSSAIKVYLLRLFGAQIGNSVVIKPSVSIKYPWRLVIGDYTWIGEHVWIDNLADVKIEAHCCISQGAMLLCGNHNYKKHTFDLIIGKIELKKGVWLGAQTVVCPGVVCQENSILTVGSVATKSLEPNTIYSGNPALPIRKRTVE